MNRIAKFSIFCMMCSVGATPALADVYRWKDANGVTQFGERPPAGGAAEQVRVTGIKDDTEATMRFNELLEANDSAREARQEKREERREQARNAKLKAEQCASAKAHRERLIGATRLFKVTADGSRERLGEEARGEDLERIEGSIAELCT
jgi:hypothetical protein